MFKKKEKDNNPVEKNVVGEFLRIQDVLGFFKYDINPSYLDAKVEAEIAKQQRGQRQVPFQWVMIIGVIIIIGVIAFTIINGQLQNNQCVAELARLAQPQERVVAPQPTGVVQPGGSGEAGIGIT